MPFQDLPHSCNPHNFIICWFSKTSTIFLFFRSLRTSYSELLTAPTNFRNGCKITTQLMRPYLSPNKQTRTFMTPLLSFLRLFSFPKSISAPILGTSNRLRNLSWHTILLGVGSRIFKTRTSIRKRCKFKKYKISRRETKRKAVTHQNVGFVIPRRGAGTFSLEPPGHFSLTRNRSRQKKSLLIPIQDLCKTVMGARHLPIGRPNQISRFGKTQK